MNLTPATEKDLAQVVQWIPDAPSALLWGGPVIRFPMTAKTLACDLEFPDHPCFVIKNHSQVTAFGQIVIKEESRLHLARIIVNPKARGNGHGRALCRALIRQCRTMGGKRITLNVYVENKIAVSLYKSLGFEVLNKDEEAGYFEMMMETQ